MCPSTFLLGGRVIIGDGTEIGTTDLELSGGRIREMKLLERSHVRDGDVLIDCEGLTLAPAFVDIHSHSDVSRLTYPLTESRVSQGIATEIVGNCGMTPAPHGAFGGEVRSSSGPLDIVPRDWPWASVRDWLAELSASASASRVGALIGHGSVRCSIAGVSTGQLSQKQRVRSLAILNDALDAGCLGISLGLMYPPGQNANLAELREIAELAADREVLLSCHLRDYASTSLVGAVREFIDILRGTGARGQISHLRAIGPDSGEALRLAIDEIDRARTELDLDLEADAYPYTAGHTTLVQLFPPSRRAIGNAELARWCVVDPRSAASALAECGFDPGGILIAKANGREDAVGHVLTEFADPWQAAVDLLASCGGDVDVIVVGAAESDLALTFSVPWISVASDGAALSRDHAASVPHPRSWGAFPRALRLLLDSGVPLAEAVKRLSVQPAKRVGLDVTLRVGAPADLVVFDPETVASRADYSKPATYADGIRTVVVGGDVVWESGQSTGERPATALLDLREPK